jgi:hypothetical protein
MAASTDWQARVHMYRARHAHHHAARILPTPAWAIVARLQKVSADFKTVCSYTLYRVAME